MPNDKLQNGGLAWPYNLMVLVVLAAPAFSGFPLDGFQLRIVAGIRWSWVLYFGCVHLSAMFFLENRLYTNILALAGLITLPVVYAGAIISWIGYHLGLVGTVPEVAGAHYVRLCLTMLTVVPLALAMVSVVPFGRIEQSLLVQSHGIGLWQKKALMAMRVFSHIAFFVLPKTLEVLREEQPVPRFHCRRQAFGIARTALLRSLLGYMVHLSVEIISAALQYIPLWAYEISRLPGDAEKRDT